MQYYTQQTVLYLDGQYAAAEAKMICIVSRYIMDIPFEGIRSYKTTDGRNGRFSKPGSIMTIE
jgi:hypothetical protein